MNKDTNIVTKDLKDYIFQYNKELKTVSIYQKKVFDQHQPLVLDKVRMLSFLRFGLRFLNSLSIRSRK